jgi:beta-lactam-binding protein with PASTA domain
MAAQPKPPEAGADEITLSDEEWPVAEQYRVEPAPAPGEQTSEPGDVRLPERLRPGRERRLSIDRRAAAVAVAALVVLVAPALAWFLASGDDAPVPPPRAANAQAGPQTPPPASASTAPASIVVPQLVGETLEGARRLLAEEGLRVRAGRVPSERPSGEVVRQAPAAGSEIAEDGVVRVTVSTGPRQVEVPEVVGLLVSDAFRAVRDAGLRPAIERVSSSEPAGTVVGQDPAGGGDVDNGALVTLRVAKPRPAPTPPPAVELPRLVGLPVADARSRLRDLGLRSSVDRIESSEPAGTVVEQAPAPGAEVRKGETVTLTVSSGPATVAVPDVTGLDEQTARQVLETAGFAVEIVDEPTTDPADDGLVVGQTPSAGTQRSAGTVVTLRVARSA